MISANDYQIIDGYMKRFYRINQKWFKVRDMLNSAMSKEEGNDFAKLLADARFVKIEGILDSAVKEKN